MKHVRSLTDKIVRDKPPAPSYMKDVTHTYWVRRICCALVKGVSDAISTRLCRAFTNADRHSPEYVSRAGGFAPHPRDGASVAAARRAVVIGGMA